MSQDRFPLVLAAAALLAAALIGASRLGAREGTTVATPAVCEWCVASDVIVSVVAVLAPLRLRNA